MGTKKSARFEKTKTDEWATLIIPALILLPSQTRKAKPFPA